VAGGDDTASLRRQGMFNIPLYIKWFYLSDILRSYLPNYKVDM
jgi:hypothetical protein